MRTFTEAMELTHGISDELTLSLDEGRAFWDLLSKITRHGTLVEIGCQRGRSSSLVLQAAQDNGFLSIHIDPWTHGEFPQWAQMAQRVPSPTVVLRMKSEEALALPWLSRVPLDLVYIDGDHDAPGVQIDMGWSERIISGGVLCVHDFGRDFLSGVEGTVRNYLSEEEWEPLGVWGTLAAWRRK